MRCDRLGLRCGIGCRAGSAVQHLADTRSVTQMPFAKRKKTYPPKCMTSTSTNKAAVCVVGTDADAGDQPAAAPRLL
jgi:hypothetical protein